MARATRAYDGDDDDDQADEYPLAIPDLIPALPADVAASCIYRLPIHVLPGIAQVSRAWRSVARKADAFFAARHVQGYSRRYIALLLDQQARDHQNRAKSPPCYGITLYDCSEHRVIAPEALRAPLLPGFDRPGLPLFCRCVSAGHRVVVLGGWHPVTWSPLPSVFVFDLATGQWRRGSDMPSPVRSLFGAAVLDDKRSAQHFVIVAGGHGPDKIPLSSAHSYDPASDTWSPLPCMTVPRDECKALVIAGRLLVLAHKGQGQAYDPSTHAWRPLPDDMCLVGNPSSAMVLDAQLHVLVDRKLLRWIGSSSNSGTSYSSGTSNSRSSGSGSSRSRSWNPVLNLPTEIAMPACAAPLPDGGILVSGFRGGGGGEAFEAGLWRCEKPLFGHAKWHRVGTRLGSVAQLSWLMEV